MDDRTATTARLDSGAASGTDPLRRALVVLVVLTVVAAAMVVALTLVPGIPYPWVFAAFPSVGAFCVLVGAWLWDRRPSNRVGRLLVVQGLLILGASLGNVDDAQLKLLGTALGEAPIGALFALVLAFPGGDVRPRGGRALVIAGYLVTVGLQVPQSLTRTIDPGVWLSVGGHEEIGRAADRLQTWSGAVVLGLGVVMALDAVRRVGGARQRRSLALVFGYGIVAIVLFPVSANVLAPHLGWNVFERFAFQQGLLAGVPVVFGFAVVLGGFARTFEVGELRRSLAEADAGTTPRDAIARVLGDPSVQVLYRLPDSDRYVDEAGRPRHLPAAESAHQVHRLEGVAEGAVIVFDARIVDRPLVEEAGRVLALAIDRDRLTAELAANRDRLLEAGREVARAGDETRRRIARDLHDSVQNRLVLAAMEIGALAASLPGDGEATSGLGVLRGHLDAAMTDLRHVVDGVMPPILVEQGIAAAVEDLVERMPMPARCTVTGADLPVPDVVASTAYFVAAETLTNVLKHAEAARVEVTLAVTADHVRLTVEDDGRGLDGSRGTGLEGLAGRVAAVGGRFEVGTAQPRGTRVHMELPCAS